jgi:hypothetical protein
MESLVFRKRFLALIYDDGGNCANQRNVLKHYTHLEGLNNVEAIPFRENIDKLKPESIRACLLRTDVDDSRNDLQKMFRYPDGKLQPQQLKELCLKTASINSNNIRLIS